jgi:hypothetical protein
MKKHCLITILVVILLTPGCLESVEPDRSIIECGLAVQNDQLKDEWLQDNITSWKELPEEDKNAVIQRVEEENASVNLTIRLYKDALNTDRTYYDELSEQNKRLFVQSINNETDVDRETLSSFLQSDDIYAGGRYIVYENELYTCFNGYPRGA